MRKFPKFQRGYDTTGDNTIFRHKYWKAIENFESVDYFKRLWIFQELWAAQEAFFICGKEYLPLGYLVFWSAWMSIRKVFTRSTKEYRHILDILRGAMPSFSQVLSLSRPKILTQDPTAFFQTMQKLECSDPHDRVFAMLGPFPTDINPDYNTPVVELYAKWATNKRSVIPPALLLHYSGIGLFPRSWNSDIHPSWLPNLQTLNRQFGIPNMGDESKPVEAPARFHPSVSRTTGLKCYGLKITDVAKVASRAFKARHCCQVVTRDICDDIETYRQELCFLILGYFTVNGSRLCTGTYPLGGSRLMAIIQTIYQWVNAPVQDLIPGGLRYRSPVDTLKRYPSIDVFKQITSHLFKDINISPADLTSMGLASEEELWEYCLGQNPTSLDFQSVMELEIFARGELPGFLMEHSLFNTTCGLIGGGAPLTEPGDMVYLIHGSRQPVLVREVEGKLRNVGICYIHGLAYLDALKILTDRESDIREINIV